MPEIAAIGATDLPPGCAVNRRLIDLITGLAGWAGQKHRRLPGNRVITRPFPPDSGCVIGIANQ